MPHIENPYDSHRRLLSDMTLWTRESLLKDEDPARDLRRVLRVYRQATEATDGETEEPDHAARIRGADGLSRVWGFEAPAKDGDTGAARPVQVAIILTDFPPDARAALPAHGVAVHLTGDGDGGDGSGGSGDGSWDGSGAS